MPKQNDICNRCDHKTYRVSVFNDGHFWDECWFPAFKEGIELDEADQGKD